MGVELTRRFDERGGRSVLILTICDTDIDSVTAIRPLRSDPTGLLRVSMNSTRCDSRNKARNEQAWVAYSLIRRSRRAGSADRHPRRRDNLLQLDNASDQADDENRASKPSRRRAANAEEEPRAMADAEQLLRFKQLSLLNVPLAQMRQDVLVALQVDQILAVKAVQRTTDLPAHRRPGPRL